MTVDEFFDRLKETGLFSGLEVRKLLQSFAPENFPQTGAQAAQRLVERGELTEYQSQAICQGRSQRLMMGNYEIRDLIGRGGMGMVFKARHRVMGRVVALKVLPPSLAGPCDAIQRFSREIKASALLEHPNIVTAYDADQADGVHYMAMKYVDGPNLAAIVKQSGPLSVEEAVSFAIQAGRGLAYAHEHGVLHRDVKPGNILIDSAGTAHVLDLGLARIAGEPTTDDDPDEDEELTRTGTVMGTASYMAPEQALDIKSADHRADIYGLGCTFFFALAGHPVFAGDNVMQKLLAHREQPIPSLHSIRDDVPEPINAIFRKMLAKNPDERYQTMAQAVADFEQCYSGVVPGDRGENQVAPEWGEERSTARTFVEDLKQRGGKETVDEGIASSIVHSESATSPVEPKDPTQGSDPTIDVDRASIINDESVTAVSDQRRSTPAWVLALAAVTVLACVAFAVGPQLFSTSDDPGVGKKTEPKSPEPKSDPKTLPKTKSIAKTVTPPPPQQGEVLISLKGDPPPAFQVLWDGEPRKLDADGFLKPLRLKGKAGPHLLEVVAEGYERYRNEELVLAPDDVRELSITLKKLPPKIAWDESGPAENVLPGLLPRPAALPRESRFQLETVGARSRVMAIAFRPDGEEFACGTELGRVRIYRTEDRKLLRILSGHTDAIASLRYSADGTRLATAGTDRVVRIWDGDGNNVATFDKHTNAVLGVSWSRDGSRLASAGMTGIVRIWRPNGEEITTLKPEGELLPISGVAWNPRQDVLAVARIDGSLTFWSPDGKRLHAVNATDDLLSSLAWNSAGDTLATTSWDGVVRFWTPAGKPAGKDVTEQKTEQIDSITWSPNGDWLVTAGTTAGKPRMFRRDGMKAKRLALDDPNQIVSGIAWSAGGVLLSAGGVSVNAWNEDGEPQPGVEGIRSRDIIVAAHPKSDHIAVGTGYGTLELWTTSGEFVRKFAGHAAAVRDLKWNAGGTLLASASDDKTTRIWKFDGSEHAIVKGHRAAVTCAAWHPDGKRLATGSEDGSVIQWTSAESQLTFTPNDGEQVQEVLWTNDGAQLAVLGNQLRFFDAQIIPVDRTVPSREEITAAAQQPNGSLLAVALASGDAMLLSPDGKSIPLDQQQTALTDVSWSPDGSQLTTCNRLGEIHVWTSQGKRATTVAGSARHAVWNRDGERVFTSDTAGTLVAWDIKKSSVAWSAAFVDKGQPLRFTAGGAARSLNPADLDKRLVYMKQSEKGPVQYLSPTGFAKEFPGAMSE